MELAGLIGADGDELERRLGAPDARREVGDDSWLIFRREDVTLRVRCEAGGSGGRAPEDPSSAASGDAEDAGARSGPPGVRVASWTVTFQEPRPTLREAVEPLGLWPACAPDVEADDVETEGGRLVRRALPDPSGPGAHSLTAGVAGRGFDRVAAFDEAPEWR